MRSKEKALPLRSTTFIDEQKIICARLETDKKMIFSRDRLILCSWSKDTRGGIAREIKLDLKIFKSGFVLKSGLVELHNTA